MRNPNGDPYMLPYVRAIPSAVAELCKIQKKCFILHILTKKTLILVLAKSVQIYTTATVIVHICVVTVALLYIILIFFLSPYILSSLTLSLLNS